MHCGSFHKYLTISKQNKIADIEQTNFPIAFLIFIWIWLPLTFAIFFFNWFAMQIINNPSSISLAAFLFHF